MAQKHEVSSLKDHPFSFNFTCPLSIPSTPESAAIRMVKNFVSLGLYYMNFVYVVLLITLIPDRKVSLVYLVGLKELVVLILLLLRALPKSFPLNNNIFKCFALFVLSIGASVALILTSDGIHLLIVLVSTFPVILVHATLWREDLKLDTSEGRSGADGEMVPFVLGGVVDGSSDSV